VSPWCAGVCYASLPCVWGDLPRPAQAPRLMLIGPWPAVLILHWTRLGRRRFPARTRGRAVLSAARPDGLEDLVKLVFHDFEVQRALGNVEFPRDLGEIAVVCQDRRHDGVTLKRFEARHGDGSRSPMG
jgi:hypothetical protein